MGPCRGGKHSPFCTNGEEQMQRVGGLTCASVERCSHPRRLHAIGSWTNGAAHTLLWCQSPCMGRGHCTFHRPKGRNDPRPQGSGPAQRLNGTNEHEDRRVSRPCDQWRWRHNRRSTEFQYPGPGRRVSTLAMSGNRLTVGVRLPATYL